MTRIVPPPPGTDPLRWVVPGEGALIASWGRRIRANALRVRHRKRLGMELEDVEEELRLAMLTAIRKYAAEKGELPPGQFLTTVIQRRAMHFNRSTRVWFRIVDEMVRQSWGDDQLASRQVEDAAPLSERQMTMREEEEAYRALVYILRANMPPAVFAILHLRIIEEMEPMDIAAITGIENNGRASKRVGYAKSVAWAFLRSLGIHTWEQVRDAAPEDFDHDIHP